MESLSISSLEAQPEDVESLPDSVDEAAVQRMQFVARLLDDSIRLPGTEFKIGLDPIVGVLPVAGDAVAAALSGYIILESARLGVSYLTLLRMLANVGVDFAVGSVPVVGDIFDVAWKANVRNLRLALADLGADAEAVEVDFE
ncbi:DUF4112 domain-containing protein [Halobacteriales archaeon QS_8_69_73]|nr:MAG: DUF4112 domain-containing protein [Halobacteriales archaeon QS_8_69_73]